MKLVVNRCYGGYGLSSKAILRVLELKGETVFAYVQMDKNLEREAENLKAIDKDYKEGFWDNIYYFREPLDLCENGDISFDELRYKNEIDVDFDREDKDLVQIVEELDAEASTNLSELEVLEIPDNHEYYIDDYDGVERIVSGLELHVDGKRIVGGAE
ncbi:hypothetical protein BMT55_16720 [Listeria newyorkensis]|uniref:Antirestriction protein (ArdA) n=1 Tax=Listeria newyorkensis TaxID=1497681 RepID=A0ABX4XHM1_9LIST|nr:hypothetical protein [Listeria newyorkensis]KGL45707.1 hypothetical protein EP58_03170 [Listeria newyorkensis]PNP86911.1 hypothetical protein BMT55_16720 [Listeria newyorkensis]SQC55361.1 Uncharacterised protein [Listeria newyorkensis]